MRVRHFLNLIATGFMLGLGFYASQEFWYFLTGLAEICHG